MSLVFGALVSQMIGLVVLLLPLPYPIRKKIVELTVVLEKSQHARIGVAFSILLLGLQFFDCLNRLKRYSDSTSDFLSHEQLASKFYAQRNLYLTGAVLYLQVAIATVVSIIRKMVKKETDYRAAKVTASSEDVDGEIAKYKQLIKLKDQDIAQFKKQLEGLHVAYKDLNPETEGVTKKDD